MNVLVVAPNWIGDALMAQPLFRLLKRDPKVRITVLAPRWVAPVLAAMPEVDAVLETAFVHGLLQWRERRQTSRRIRKLNFDAAFILPNSLKSALIPLLARIPVRIGYRGEARSLLLTRTLPNPKSGVPMTERYMRLVDAHPPTAAAPVLLVPAEKSEVTATRFGLDLGRPIIALCPGAEFGPAKRWPARHFAKLADLLHAEDPARQLIILGSEGDRAIGDEIAGGCKAPIRILAGETTLTEGMELIAGCTGMISNDSGLMHVAAALGRPQVAIFGSTDPTHTPPRSARAQVLWLHLSCSPCFQRVCPLGHLNCLNQIEPERVHEALRTAADL